MSDQKISIDSSWTLFLDRDGVINRRIIDGYVTKPEEFHILPGVLEFITWATTKFARIIVVTNQQGIGKGLMTSADLSLIHTLLVNKVAKSNGKIDAIFHAPGLKTTLPSLRKPGPGMALLAQKQFPDINFGKSIMVGDTPSDISFGKNLGMRTVFIITEAVIDNTPEADLMLPNLFTLKKYLVDNFNIDQA